MLVVADQVEETSAEAIVELRRVGLRPILLTGDNGRVARMVPAQVGIDGSDVYAEVLPAEKLEVVKRLQAEGGTVAMVGDGVNDAAALAQSDLGLAMGTGTDVAMEAGDITLVRGDLRVAADAIRLSRRTLGVIRSNLFWAFGYNVVAIPIAAAGLLNPMLACAAMAFSWSRASPTACAYGASEAGSDAGATSQRMGRLPTRRRCAARSGGEVNDG